jgi:hypothetical protein
MVTEELANLKQSSAKIIQRLHLRVGLLGRVEQEQEEEQEKKVLQMTSKSLNSRTE